MLDVVEQFRGVMSFKNQVHFSHSVREAYLQHGRGERLGYTRREGRNHFWFLPSLLLPKVLPVHVPVSVRVFRFGSGVDLHVRFHQFVVFIVRRGLHGFLSSREGFSSCFYSKLSLRCLQQGEGKTKTLTHSFSQSRRMTVAGYLKIACQ